MAIKEAGANQPAIEENTTYIYGSLVTSKLLLLKSASITNAHKTTVWKLGFKAISVKTTGRLNPHLHTSSEGSAVLFINTLLTVISSPCLQTA